MSSINLIDQTLKSTKRKVKIRELSMDKLAELNDIPEIVFKGGTVSTINNLNRAKLEWMRAGLGGGDFNEWSPNGSIAPDSVLRQLTEVEQDELVDHIKASQVMTKKK